MRFYITLSILLSSLLICNVAMGANSEAAKTTAAGICAGCHGPKGISITGTFPNLAGQKEEYLVLSLKAFRNKTRNAPIMNNMAANLKDEDIANLAAYFAGLKPGE